MSGASSSIEEALKARKEEFRAARREALAGRKAVKEAQGVCRVLRRSFVAAQKRRKAQQVSLRVANGNLELCRRKGWSLEGARKRLAAARQRLKEEQQAEAEARRALRGARSDRVAAARAAGRAIARRDKAHGRIKVQALKLRQARAAIASDAARARRLQALHTKHVAQRRELASKHREAKRQLEERLKQEVSGFKRKAAEKAQEEASKRRRRATAYSAALRNGDPMHADKFHRHGASAVAAKAEDPDFSGRLSVLRPRGQRHEYTLVYLHQFCLNGTNYVDWKPHYFFSSTKLPYLSLKVALPTAKAIPITVHGGMKQYAWYDYKTDYEGQREDKLESRSLRETRDRIFQILDREIALLDGDASRVFLGGASQGCCTALHCALQYPRVLGGFVGIVGHLLSCSPLPQRKKHLPIYLYNGKADTVMCWSWVRTTYRRFKDAGFADVHIHTEEGVTHEKPVRKEREWILDFLSKMIPKQGAQR